MKIECEKIEHKSYSTECKVDHHCCRMMKKALKDYPTTYGDGSGYFSPIFNIDECGIKIPLSMSEYNSKQGVCIINYCPWCGQEIE